MKKLFRILLGSIVVLAAGFIGLRFYTKSHSPFEKIEAKHKDLQVAVEYSKPYAKGRKIFGGLVPYGQVWRTGANEASLIAFSRRCTIGGKKIVANTYSLWTIPGENAWEIILNTETGQWGTNYDESKDQLRFKVMAEKSETLQEQLDIDLLEKPDGIDMRLTWENTKVIVPIK
jgi:hypothetical protein